MAAVLPYPSMDFVPLDILTAAELNQMVANTEYLATYCNGLASGTNLVDGAIKTRQLDSTAFTLAESGGYKGYIDTAGKKHRYKVMSGTSNVHDGMFLSWALPSDMGTYGTDYVIETYTVALTTTAFNIVLESSGGSLWCARLSGTDNLGSYRVYVSYREL